MAQNELDAQVVTIGGQTYPRLEFEKVMADIEQTQGNSQVLPVEADIRETLYACKTVDQLIACDLVGDVDRERCETLKQRLSLIGDLLPEELTSLQAGDKVMLSGLQSFADLNGAKGELGTYDPAANRWEVPDLGVRVRPANVIADKWLSRSARRQNCSVDVKGFTYLVRFELDGSIRWLWQEGKTGLCLLSLA